MDMAETPPVETPTIRQHKRQFFWQILFPMLMVVLLGLVVGGLVIAATVTGQGQTRLWADVSIIWLLAPMLFLALGLVVVMFALVYGLAKLLQVTPTYTGKAQGFFAQVVVWTHKIADAVVKPFFWLDEAGATIKSFFKW